MNEFRRWLARRQLAVSVGVLVLLAYLPALTAAPGRMPSDSKLYVYLNPARFLADTTTTFDPRQFAGWVPHQHIAYLWPMGPWFWFFDAIGVPDWLAHRLWVGTLLVAAGLGVRWVARLLGLGPTAALAAAIVYQLSPYILPYVSRTSILLLPYAGLGWIVGLTVLAAQRGRWRFAAGVSLVVLTVGAVNATALAMIIPAPALWLVHAVWQRSITWRRALATAAKVGVLSIAVSLWWIAMLLIQGKRGADVLAYSESLESVSFTSTSTEVLRGLGYWLFYIRDAFGATTTASLDYMASTRVIVFGIGLLAVVLSGLVFTTWQHRRYVALLIGSGLVLAVGVHPIDDPSPLMSLLVGDGEGGLALALRSSTRAVPVLVFGLALSAASLVAACGSIRLPGRRAWSSTWSRSTWTWGGVTAIVITLLAVGYLPSLRNGGFVDPQLERDQDPPQAWLDASARLDSLPAGYRVLQLPGGEFGAFRWGYTVDQPLPSLTERPLLTRDLLPLGSAAAMDLVFALDDRFQDGVVDVDAIAPVARLLGVDTIWVADDVAFDRFRLARPEIVDDLLTGPGAADADLLPAERFGEPAPNVGAIPVVDEQSVSDRRVGAPLATVSLVGVDAPVATIRAKDDVVVLSGSGDGLVDAAGAGVIDGSELILYSASLSGDSPSADRLSDAVSNATRVVVTDSNRDRAHHWRGSQDVTGYTEAGDDVGVLRNESGDQRLPVFADDDPDTQTISIQDGPVTATASAYGEPFAYLPEHRPVMAIDGDPSTSWTVGDRGQALDESIVLDVSEPIDHLTLRQPDTVDGQRRITEVELTVDDRDPALVVLDESSLVGDGQRIDIDPTTAASRITLRITGTGTEIDVAPIGAAVAGVGFATIDVGLEPTTELIRVPVDATTAMTDAAATTPLSAVFTRLRTDPTDRWRSDPEPALRRQFTVPNDAAFDTSVVLRADQRMDDTALAELLDEAVAATAHLTGVPGARGASAVDGDIDTSWITPFGSPVGQSLHLALDGTANSVAIAQPAGTFSPITQVRISDPTGSFELDVDQAGTDVALPRTIDLSDATIEIIAVDGRTTVDRRFGEAITLPAAISEITFDGVSPPRTPADGTPAGEHVEECRDDLLQIDGTPVGLSFTASTEAILRGEPIDATLCAAEGASVLALAADTHTLTSTPGAASGFHVDQVVLAEPDDGAGAEATTAPSVTVTSTSRTGRTVEVAPCPEGCWVVLGEGYNPAWTASDASGSLGPPTLVDGNANGWFIGPTDEPTTVTFHWTAQRTLNVALLASLLGVLACIALVIADRRRAGDALVPVPVPRPFPPSRWGAETVGVPTVILTTVASAVLIGWIWGAVALAVSLAAYALRRQRLLAAFGFLIVIVAQCIVMLVVRRDRPFPNAGFPVHFEWLHPWTLLGVILLTCSALLPGRSRLPDSSKGST